MTDASATVYDAWTNPNIAAKFLSPGNMKATDIKMDVRVGGAFSLVMVRGLFRP